MSFLYELLCNCLNDDVLRDDYTVMSFIKWKSNEVKYTINDIDAIGRTVLHLALQNGLIKVVKYLITNGADTNVVTTNGTTMLHYAVKCGHVGVVKLLIKSGNNVNAMNNYNFTPLYYAIIYGYIGIVKLLIKKGAKVTEMMIADVIENYDDEYYDIKVFIKILKILLNEMMYA